MTAVESVAPPTLSTARPQTRDRGPKSTVLYGLIIALAMVLTAAMLWTCAPVIAAQFHHGVLFGLLTCAVLLFIAYFWLNGSKDLIYPIAYHAYLKDRLFNPPPSRQLNLPRVMLLYCTCNDFNADSLARSIDQDYLNFGVAILDDSNDPTFQRQIDDFAATYRGDQQIRVVRRADRAGFKAGNLNNFLAAQADWDYFVILDSDEIIPRNFINRALDYFVAAPGAGIVQANHVATRNRNKFMALFAHGVDSHWPVYQSIKRRFGFMSLLGHGAMVSRECYEAAGGFPHVVAEDICFSIAARDAGFYTEFAQDIVCEEEFPPDYLAFKKRHGKWTEGNMEFIKNYTRIILRSNMRWFEKLDIVLFTYALPLTSVFSVYILINVVFLPVSDSSIRFPVWMLVPTVLFLLAPLMNDVIWHWPHMRKRRLAKYLGMSTLLFGSMYLISLKASIKSMVGGSFFTVTPKVGERVGPVELVRHSSGFWAFAFTIAAISWLTTGSVLPVTLLMIPALAAPYLIRYHQG
ncbi:cellulose synthase/poly-beta-1,6-N-acetylglucosamine synthase-like glycosyltransferase [Branchiibius hedensis]|uniref:Glycosyltransferase, catalytic subunit of cellulose synthase and poly-beta-1,6-N-acetylglucosamine synthase n=1 Tax=Branchiibius hedensis TaxID=672460 RepID=A0A2Y9C0Z3_9MICO|nr:glycosyltransferase family 2 protein [Branchiibius hedensis]PWJ24556.1 cellulose synthase/poly-beta-1,6-N-acetylglucosamine synthase-like glycosyltransferase [Branchiibius hedensis]SSA33373.1 Glycosyltransferase, catalytic subunit of cellulose synthase and poly-beta-1,6-N-acetylglucosamine synthase [Branchiibius hedensis]